MAVLNLGGCGGDDDKENAPPPPPPPPSAARGVGVKNRAVMKRPGAVGSRATRRRAPLRDITGLFLAAQCRPPPALAEAPEQAETGGAPDGVTLILKQGRYSLRKEFR